MSDEPITKSAEDATWKSFVHKQQAPLERSLTMAVRRYLKGYAARIAMRVPDVIPKKVANGDMITKQATEEWMIALLNAAVERANLQDALEPTLRTSITDAFKEAIANMPADFDAKFDEDTINDMVQAQIAKLVKDIEPETEKKVRKAVQDGLKDGESVNEIQQRIITSAAFNASRSLRIARTEATKAINLAGIRAWEQNTPSDMSVEFVWLTAGDESVRDAHKRLNGVVRGPDGYWRIGADKAEAPGEFSSAANSVNCRCTFLPRVR